MSRVALPVAVCLAVPAMALGAGWLVEPSARDDPAILRQVCRLRFLTQRIHARFDAIVEDASARPKILEDLGESDAVLARVEGWVSNEDPRELREHVAAARAAWGAGSTFVHGAFEAEGGARRHRSVARSALDQIHNLLASSDGALRARLPASALGATELRGALVVAARELSREISSPIVRADSRDVPVGRLAESIQALRGGGDAAGPLVADLVAADAAFPDEERFRESLDAVHGVVDRMFQASDDLALQVEVALAGRHSRRARALQLLLGGATGLAVLALGAIGVLVFGRKAREVRVQSLALENVAEAVVLTDAAGRIRYANRAFERISGFGRNEALGQTPALLKSGLQDPPFYDTMWRTILGGQTWSGRIVNRRRDGSLFETDQTIAPAFERGSRIGFVSVFRDASGEQQAERLRTLGELVAEVAHEVANPLNNVSLGLETLREMCPLVQPDAGSPRTAPCDRSHDVFRTMRASVTRIAEFVRELRGFARPDDLRTARFLVGDVARSAEILVSTEARRKGVAVEVDVAPDLALTGHPRRLEQALVNLLANAIEAVPSDGGRVRLAAVASPGQVELSVEDNGPGVAPEVALRLFQPFVTTRQDKGGTGLGLALCARVAAELGGTIALDPRAPGTGTRFRLVVPVQRGAPPERREIEGKTVSPDGTVGAREVRC